MDGFLLAVGLTLVVSVVAAIWIARMVYVIVGRALDDLFRAFQHKGPG
jgi:hypothetical protein